MSTSPLDDFVAKGWDDHAGDAAGVFDRFPTGLALVTEAKHVPPFAGLVVHVAGEHLGRWKEGIDLLRRLERPPLAAESPEGRSLARSRSVLELCAGDRRAAERSALAGRTGASLPFASDLARILAIAAAALAGQKRVAEASEAFEEACALASYGPTAADPTSRALAVTANNLAAAYEDRTDRTATEDALMKRAANVARDFWGLAGTWLQAERAEYRCSFSHRKAGDLPAALEHARRCQRIIEANGNDPYEALFAHEALAFAHHALGDGLAAARERAAMAALVPSVSDADSRAFCEGQLAVLDRALAG